MTSKKIILLSLILLFASSFIFAIGRSGAGSKLIQVIFLFLCLGFTGYIIETKHEKK